MVIASFDIFRQAVSGYCSGGCRMNTAAIGSLRNIARAKRTDKDGEK